MGDSRISTTASSHRPSASYGSIPIGEENGSSTFGAARRQRRRRSSILLTVLGDDDDCCHVQQYRGRASLLSQVVTISKNIMGAAALFLPKGIAIYGDSPKAAYTACLWIAFAGLLFAYFGILIARVCEITQASTYSECWDRSVGNRGSSLISFTVSMITTLQPAIAYLGLAGVTVETFLPLLQAVGLKISMTQLLLILTIGIILPLCLKGKNLLSLAPISFLGVFGMVYTAVAMTVRWIDGSYKINGQYYDDEDLHPAFGSTNNAWSTAVLPFFCIIFEAWVMHYNSPRYYTELKDASVHRFIQTMTLSFGGTALIYMTIAATGFLTFGRSVQAYVLNSYSPRDPLLTIGRLAIGTALLNTLPLVFVGVRDGLLDCLSIGPHQQTTLRVNAVSIVLLAMLTVASTFLMSSLDVIKAATQGILATLLVFVFPQIMYRQAVTQQAPHSEQKWPSILSMLLTLVGVVLGVSGVVVYGSMAGMMHHAMPSI